MYIYTYVSVIFSTGTQSIPYLNMPLSLTSNVHKLVYKLAIKTVLC